MLTGSGVTSVVIPAHNEQAVLGRCLRRLLADAAPGEFEVVVAANGCTDGTARVARAVPGVAVVEVAVASKSAALNAGDEVAVGFPRIYLDADIELTTADARALAAAVATAGEPTRPGGPGRSGRTAGATAARATGTAGDPTGTAGDPVLAAAPRRVLDTAGRPLLVRAYYAVNGRLPAFRHALFGRGVIALSRPGRARFESFPEIVSDDLFLDSLFAPDEKREVAEATATVATPMRTRHLLRRLGRLRAGNAMLRTTGGAIPASRHASWLFDVVLPRPWLLPAGACYAVLTLIAERSSRRPATRANWGRDESSRAAATGRDR
jgi:glycosyltransferase involved in cell wall biosynthesis